MLNLPKQREIFTFKYLQRKASVIRPLNKMKNKYTVGDVVLLKSELKSFSWNDGLHIIIACDEESVRLCRLDEDMKPPKFEDGRYMCSVTGVNNKGISKTNLTYKLEPNFTYL